MKASFASIAALGLMMSAAQAQPNIACSGDAACMEEGVLVIDGGAPPATKADIDALKAELDWIKGQLSCLITKMSVQNMPGFSVACGSP